MLHRKFPVGLLFTKCMTLTYMNATSEALSSTYVINMAVPKDLEKCLRPKVIGSVLVAGLTIAAVVATALVLQPVDRAFSSGQISTGSNWIIDLGSSSWTVTSSDECIKVPAQVPGGIYTDLEKAKVLPSPPYYRFNDLDFRWVSKENWTYYRKFDVSSKLLSKDRIVLVCDGLDTVSTITLNDVIIGTSDNMFIKYIYDVKEHLQKGNNYLSIAFESPVEYAERMYEKQLLEYEIPPKCVPPAYRGECHANHIRKMQASFSWDWGPAFPSVGIWKDIGIEAFNCAVIRDVTAVISRVDGNEWTVEIRIFLDLASTNEETGNVIATLAGQTVNNTVYLVPDSEKHAKTTLNMNISESAGTQWWWPNGYGDQALHNLTVTFTSSVGKESSSKTILVGFRTVELVQDHIPNADGLTFSVKVNGVTMFMKGSNWIPAHVLPEKMTKEYVRDLLWSAKEANMNCLRVWGGGIYESDTFYKIADELGILIWQDFMFACSMYPSAPYFLSSVKQEVRYQVRRLQHHPSILLWAGNNENEAALVDNWYHTDANFDQYLEDYVKLYADVIKSIVEDEDPFRPFALSSPSNGQKTEEEGGISKNPYSNLYGDVHYYNYMDDPWEWKIYPRTRFASEYGLQSYPSFEALAKISEAEDWSYYSKFVNYRQHHPLGNLEILFQISRHLNLPSDLSSVEGFKNVIYLSQINQAMGIKTGSEFFRRGMSEVANNSQGLTMGALYWQLNDIWQAPTWSSIEFGGKWKMLHYYALNFFSPVIVSPFETEDGFLEVYVISDVTRELTNLTLGIQVYKWDNMTPPYEITYVFHQPPLTAQSVYRTVMSDMLETSGCSLGTYPYARKNYCFIYFTLHGPDDGKVGPDNVMFLSGPKDSIGLSKANVQIKEVGDPKSSSNYRLSFDIKLSTDAIAPFVWLDAEDVPGRFSDNGFTMLSADGTVTFFSKQDITKEELKSKLTIMSYTDVQ